MNLRGLDVKGIYKWDLNRKLTVEEIKNQLSKDISVSDNPSDMYNIVRINNAFVEIVDRWYADKGVPSLFGFLAFIFASTMFFIFGLTAWEINELGAWLFLLAAVVVMCAPCIFFSYQLFSLEICQNIYYPIVLDRVNGMVYVTLPKGRYLEASWDNVYVFIDTLSSPASGTTHELRAHLLDEHDNVTETFSLSGAPSSHYDKVCNHWEFLRRFMSKECNVNSLIKSVDFCLPIKGKSEKLQVSIIVGMTLLSHMPILQIFISPLLFLMTISRRVVVNFSTLPKWPDNIYNKIPNPSKASIYKDDSTNPEFNVVEKIVSIACFVLGGAGAIVLIIYAGEVFFNSLY